ncbi:MAG: glycosyltransferase family 39 protein [Phycisphaerae bacterium]
MSWSSRPFASSSQAGGHLAALPLRRRHVVAAACCVAALYLAGVTNSWWPTPDSALYQGLGRSMIRGEGYRFNGEVNTEVTPGMPAVLGALWWAFGDGFWAPNLLVVLCGLGGLGMAYLTLARRMDRQTAFIVVLATSLCYRSYDYSHLILTDAPFALLFWLLAYACVRALEGSRAWLCATVPLTVAAVVVRAPGLMIIGPWAVGVVLDGASKARLGRRLAIAALVLAAGAVVGGSFYWLARSISGEQPAYAVTATMNSGLLARLYRVAVGLARLPGAMVDSFTAQRSAWLAPVGIALVVLAVAGGVRLWRAGRRLIPATCLVNFVGTCFLIGFPSVRARYMMPIYPMILLLVLHGVFWGVELLSRRRGSAARPAVLVRAAVVFAAALAAVNAPLVLRSALYYSYYGHIGRYHELIEGGRYCDLYEAADVLRRDFGPGARIVSRWDRARMYHFLTGRRIEPLFAQMDRWKPCHAEAVYNDFRSRPSVDAVLFDTGGLVESYTRQVTRLFDEAPDLKVRYRGKFVTIYERVRPGAGDSP